MSHYCVLIIGKDPEMQLYPFEDLGGEEDLASDQIPSDPRLQFEVDVPAPDLEIKAREIILTVERDGHSPDLSEKYRRLLQLGRTEEILKSWFGGQKRRNGDWGYYRNPEAKWDWFVFGGRWAGKLIVKPGRSGILSLESRGKDAKFSPLEVDQARFGDIDWEKTREAFLPYAVLKRGQWHEHGGMYFLGDPDIRKTDPEWEEEISRLLEEVPADETVSVYDCHT